MKIRTLIVDDEPLSRERIRRMLGGVPDIDTIGECVGGAEALRSIRSERPDLVFLDVQMPEMSGFDVLRRLDPELMPVVIFVTAYDAYALKAFEFHAIDYLLKPFEEDRLYGALTRARDEVKKRRFGSFDERIGELLRSLNEEDKYVERFVLKSVGRVYFIRASEIDWIEAAGNYVSLHVDNSAHLLRETMNNIESRLDPLHFIRIHRSHIVNIDFIRELSPLFNGDYKVTLQDDTTLTLSRRYHDRLTELFDRSS